MRKSVSNEEQLKFQRAAILEDLYDDLKRKPQPEEEFLLPYKRKNKQGTKVS